MMKKINLIKVIEEEVEKFIRDWQNSAYEWNTEVEIQSEIYYRLIRKINNKRKLFDKIRYKVKDERNKDRQKYRRVCCEPLTFYRNQKGNICHGFPDIVVYDDLEKPKDYVNPPDFDGKKKVNCPMLWICEIKYQNEFSGGSSSASKRFDKEKMKSLLKFDKGKTKFACFLDFDRAKPNTVENYIKIKDVLYRERLITYKIKLPI